MTKLENFNRNSTSVLIVEDETVLAIGMEYSLEELGFEVSGIETTAKAAISHVKEKHPDIVLMDINLKGLETGIDAAKIIWEASKTPVVFLTSYSDDKTIKEAMESEPYGYLLKPCRDEELKVTIQTALHKHKYFLKNKDFKDEKKESKLFIECENGFLYHKGKNILYKEAEVIKLTGNETRLFDILSDYPNEPISYERIGDYIWGDDGDYTGKLRTLIYRVKNKLSYDLLENVYEIGYKLKIK